MTCTLSTTCYGHCPECVAEVNHDPARVRYIEPPVHCNRETVEDPRGGLVSVPVLRCGRHCLVHNPRP